MEEHNPQNPQPPHSKTKLWMIIILIIALFGSFRYGLYLGKQGYVFEPKEFSVVNQKDRIFDVDYNLLWNAIDTVSKKYIDRSSIDQQKILYGAIHGAVAAAGDEYTQFFDPEELKGFEGQLSGTFEGIGAEIGKKDSNIVIVSPLADSPAEKAGLRPQDIIAAVNGEQTSGWAVDQAVSKIRRPKGTEVTLTIFREGETKTRDVKIVRQKIDVKSVKLEYKEQQGKKIAIISISVFGEDTKELFDKAVNDALAAGSKGVIIDLRNNPGGYLESAVEVASQWIEKDKVVVTEAHSEKQNQVHNSFGYRRLAGMKTIVLINGGSASASEIVAGALQDYKAATLIGEKSFGKGSVQELVDLPGGSAVKVTVAKWITPNGKNLNKDGLNPDIEVKFTEDDAKAGKDPQLDKALEEAAK
jgi:carboxyl-terminal processing protease